MREIIFFLAGAIIALALTFLIQGDRIFSAYAKYQIAGSSNSGGIWRLDAVSGRVSFCGNSADKSLFNLYLEPECGPWSKTVEGMAKPTTPKNIKKLED